MWRRFKAWATNPRTWIFDPDQITTVASADELADRHDAVKLILLTALDEQDRQWPEDQDAQLIDLACNALRTLGIDLKQPAPGEVPVIPGRSW